MPNVAVFNMAGEKKSGAPDCTAAKNGGETSEKKQSANKHEGARPNPSGAK